VPALFTSPPTSFPHQTPLAILIAEDDLPTSLVLQRAVKRLGFSFVACADGEAAWAQFRVQRPDVVISDWRMPGIEGPELCRRARATEPYTYFILATALDDSAHELEGMRAGADDYLRKPVAIDELEARLIAAERVVSLHRHLAASVDRRDALLRVARRFTGEHGLDVLMRDVLGEALQLLGAGGGEVRRWRPDTLELVEAVRLGVMADQTVLEPVEAATNRAASLRVPVVLNDDQPADNDGAIPGERLTTAAVAAAPLLHEGQLLGTLAVFSTTRGARFSLEDAELLELLAGLAGAALATGEAFDRQERAVEELRHLSRAKAEFVSIVSHEFRTPLTGIQGFSEMMRDEDLSVEELREFAGDINKDAHRLSRLVSEMLDLDRMESGRMTIQPELVSLNALIEEVAATARPHAPRHSIELQLDASLPQIEADRDKLVQILTNLVDNAIKYAPKGGPVVIRSWPDGSSAHVVVRDRGIGIPRDALETIFERYIRVDSPQTRGISGTGLGLPIVREIARLHGGRTWAESPPSGGSTFHLTFPLTASRAGVGSAA
jgi:signal transduction histidine kinase